MELSSNVIFEAPHPYLQIWQWPERRRKPQALYELRSSEYDGEGNLLLGYAFTVDANRNLVYSSTDRKIGLLGGEGLVVVDTPDAVMVSDVERSQDVKGFTERLKR